VTNLQSTLDGKQPLDATFTSLAALGSAADNTINFSGTDTTPRQNSH
jgi:hypothetical protein